MPTEADQREAALLRRDLAAVPMDIATVRGMIAFEDFDPDQPRDEQGRWAPTGRADAEPDAYPRFRIAEGDKSCQQLLSERCDGLGQRKFPSQFLVFTFDELLEARAKNAPGSDTAYKILNDNRLKKRRR